MSKLPNNTRTCIACRNKENKYSMIRVVKLDSGFVIDKTNKANGRGVYICKCNDCISKVIKKKILNKIFHCDVNNEIYKELEEYIGQ